MDKVTPIEFMQSGNHYYFGTVGSEYKLLLCFCAEMFIEMP